MARPAKCSALSRSADRVLALTGVSRDASVVHLRRRRRRALERGRAGVPRNLPRCRLAQCVGRLHREHHAKREVVVYDYVDSGVPMLARMALKRQSGYRSLGYEVTSR
jgi:hypothetical protein